MQSGILTSHQIQERIIATSLFDQHDVEQFNDVEYIRECLELMDRTVSWWHHVMRLVLGLVFIALRSDAAGWALLFELIPSTLEPHPSTAALGTEWFGLRQSSVLWWVFIQHVVVQFCGSGMEAAMWVHCGGTSDKFPLLADRMRRAVAGLVALCTGYATLDMCYAAPKGFLLGIGQMQGDECEAEFSPDLAAAMYRSMIVMYMVQLFTAAVHALQPENIGFKMTLLVGLGDSCGDPLEASRTVPHWFWFLVLRFTPYDDAALSMMMECLRLAWDNVLLIVGRKSWFFGPFTATLELAHWGLTIGAGCHWPFVLWLRVPVLADGTLKLFLNVQLWLRSRGVLRWCRKPKHRAARILRPCSETEGFSPDGSRLDGHFQDLGTINIVMEEDSTKRSAKFKGVSLTFHKKIWRNVIGIGA